MDDFVGMKKRECQSNIVAEVDLNVKGNLLQGVLEEVCQAAIHELHQ